MWMRLLVYVCMTLLMNVEVVKMIVHESEVIFEDIFELGSVNDKYEGDNVGHFLTKVKDLKEMLASVNKFVPMLL